MTKINRTEESFHAAALALLAEGVAVTLFLAMLLLWVAIIEGKI